MVLTSHMEITPHSRYVGEQRNFFAFFLRDRPVGAAQQRVGLNTDFAQLLWHRVLGGLGLQFASGGDPGHIAQVHKGASCWGPYFRRHLAHGFEERQGLDVTHGAANFHNRDIHRIRLAKARAAFDEFLDFVGDMGNDLHGLAQVITAALFVEHALVDLAGGEVVGLAHPRFDETLVVAQGPGQFLRRRR